MIHAWAIRQEARQNLIEQGKVSEQIRTFLNGLTLLKTPFAFMVTQAAEEIAVLEKGIATWKQIQQVEKDYARLEITCLWIHALSGDIIEAIQQLMIQETMLKLESPEFDATMRQRMSEEVKRTLTEIKTISDDLRKSQPASPWLYK